MFDECFEFSVTLESCRDPSAMLAFTVMDHDVLTANDFAGEAFLALNSIPGVTDAGSSVDNFHGLKQIDLVLMQQYDKSKLIFSTLLRTNVKTNSRISVSKRAFSNWLFCDRSLYLIWFAKSVHFISDHPILQILETRPGDKVAADFVKKQKLRLATNT